MEYNIGFTLGDPTGRGHHGTVDYHIVANHSVNEISEAYKKTTKLLGFDFVRTVGSQYMPDWYIPCDFTRELLKLGIINKEHLVTRQNTSDLWYEFDDTEDEFVSIYFSIVKYSLPDLEWRIRDLEEEILDDLYGAAYGFIDPC